MFVSRDAKLHPDAYFFWTIKPKCSNGNFAPHMDLSDPDVWLGECSVDLLLLLCPDLADKLPAPGECIEIPDAPVETCKWTLDDADENAWRPECGGDLFWMSSGTPSDNKMVHCCYCGKKIEEVKA